MDNITNQLKALGRHGTLILLFLLTFILVGASRDVAIQTVLTTVTMEAIALWLCYLVFYVVSPINFLANYVQSYNEGMYEDAKTLLPIVGCIIVAVHLLCAIIVSGVYFTYNAPLPSAGLGGG